MAKLILCAAKIGAGVRHRYIMLSQVKAYADRYGYRVRMLWGATGGVADHRHEELFAPIPGIDIQNISKHQLRSIADLCARDGGFVYHGEPFHVARSDRGYSERFFSWDLAGSEDLSMRVPRPIPQLVATPSAPIQADIRAWVGANRVHTRLGIRVRAIEQLHRTNRVHRIKAELDAALQALYRIPWYVPVFIVTDSEYIQQRLASHFADSVFIPKKFEDAEAGGRYVRRSDKDAMKTFIKEIGCLCACKKIISNGGFLNDASVEAKIIRAPYREAAYMNAAIA